MLLGINPVHWQFEMAELPTAPARGNHHSLRIYFTAGVLPRTGGTGRGTGILGLQDGANTTLKSAALRHPEPDGTGKLGKFPPCLAAA